jgi:ubiquinone/menaquinone biosynthesis C-methylase UbiE
MDLTLLNSMKFEDYSRTFLHFHDETAPELLVKTLPKAEFRLADFGAGDGVFLVALQRGGHLARAKSIVAIDISEDRCERLRQCTDIRVVCSDVTRIPELEDSSVDYIINTQVIEHVDEDKLLGEIKRVLRPGGTLYIASLVSSLGNDKYYMLKYGWRYGWRFYNRVPGRWFVDPTHLREYESKEHFVGVIEKAGFSVVESGLTPLRLSFFEFVMRRIIVPLFKVQDPNGFFLRHRFLDFLRRKIRVQPPGYFLVEAVAINNK